MNLEIDTYIVERNEEGIEFVREEKSRGSGFRRVIKKQISHNSDWHEVIEDYSRTGLSKPTLYHCIRVGSRLYNEKYPNNVIIAGFLHDLLEDIHTSKDEIISIFGENVANLVAANTKNEKLNEPTERREELIMRCVKTSEEATIIKAADILDNFEFYTNTNTQEGIEYCKNNARLLKKYLPESYKDPIFKEVSNILN